MTYVVMVVTGGLLGLIVGIVRKDGFYGDVGEMLMGIIGGLIGGFIYSLFGVETTLYLGEILSSLAGAGVVLIGLNSFRTA